MMNNLIIKVLKKMFPPMLYSRFRNTLLSMYYFIPKIRIARKKIEFDHSLEPKLSYACLVPRENEIVFGGKVKLIRLAGEFPEQSNKFNILYLISSALPRHLTEWIRLCKDKGVKIVLNQNGVYYKGWYGEGWEAGNQPLRQALLSADFVIYQSKFSKLGADKFLGNPAAGFSIIYNAVDTLFFTPDTRKNQNPLTILLGGNQYQYYRLEAAARVVSHIKTKVPDVRLLITGRFNWLNNQHETGKIATALFKGLNIENNVRILGPYLQKDAPDIYRQAHIFLHTKYNDPCPTAVIEAMACGLPVVYSKSGGVAELADESCGIGINAELSWENDVYPDPKLLAEAVMSIAEKRDKFSEAARERAVKNFDLRTWLNEHNSVFYKALRQ
jgi:glycosyltransferase involved in cell wall biosynthesis